MFFASVLLAALPPLIPYPREVHQLQGECIVRESVAKSVKATHDGALPAEGYRLHVGTNGIRIASADAAGEFYAHQTLRQLAERQGYDWRIPCVDIVDAPRFRYRGLHFDDCRHFFGKDVLKRFIDRMAAFKYNVLHWHLTDDQGWRLEIRRYPDLVKYGAVRPSSPRCRAWSEQDNVPYGPFFYTQEDVREILAYAHERHVTVMPEIELPGHARAALAAYPQYSCRGESLLPREPWTLWGVTEDVFCPGNDETLAFIRGVLDEVCELFPDSPMIHIGGDEVPKTRWKDCPKCQRRIREKGLKDEKELHTWTASYFANYLRGKGRRAVGWSDIIEGGIPEDAVIMCWRNQEAGQKAAASGRDFIMCPGTHCYFDLGQCLPGDGVPYGVWTKPIPLHKVYSYFPEEDISPACRKHLLGVQACHWSESIRTEKELEWHSWPRALALSEVVWTAPDVRDYDEFKSRVVRMVPYLNTMGITPAPVE